MSYDYNSCDGNAGPTLITEKHPCMNCGTLVYWDLLYKSRLNCESYCEDCCKKVVEEDERDYPGDKGNHRIEDFKQNEGSSL